MSRRRKWITVGVLLGLVGVGIGIYFAWGAKLEAEYERRVQALRDHGDYVDEPRFWYPQVPAEENAAVVLKKAAELLAKLQRDDEDLAGALSGFMLRGWDSEFHVAEDYDRLRREWPKLDGYFAQVDRARRKPTFAPPPLEPDLDVVPWCGIQELVELLKLRARVQPQTAPDVITLLLDLADRWRPDRALEMRVRFTVRSEALDVLRVGLGEGTLDVGVHRHAWDGKLASVEPVAVLRDILRFDRMGRIRTVEQLRRGEDPWAEVRELLQEWEEELKELDLELGQLAQSPWYASWYGRPILYRNALEALNELAFGIEHATSEESLRETLADEHISRTELGVHGFGAYADALEHLAVLRLARIAMVVQQDGKIHGGPRKKLDEHTGAFDGALPPDPFTGKPFLYQRHDDRVVLSCSVAVPGEGEWESLRSALIDRFVEDLLVWEVRWAPAKQGAGR